MSKAKSRKGKKDENKKIQIHPMFAKQKSKVDKCSVEKSEMTTKLFEENPTILLRNPDQLPLSIPSPQNQR